MIHIRSQVKTRQSQSYKFKNIAKNSNFEILQQTLHTSHLQKLLDKMYNYEMAPTRTVGATEQNGIHRWTDGRMDGQTGRRSETNIPLNNFLVRGVKLDSNDWGHIENSYEILNLNTLKFPLPNTTDSFNARARYFALDSMGTIKIIHKISYTSTYWNICILLRGHMCFDVFVSFHDDNKTSFLNNMITLTKK